VILVLDTVVLAGSHVPFNSALLRVLHLAYPQEDILMGAAGSHIAILRCEPGMEAVRFDLLDEQAGKSFGALLLAYIRDQEPENVVVSGCSAEQLRVVREIASRRRDISFDAFMHSELAEPAHWRSRNPLTRRKDMFGTIARGFPANMRLVVLEYAIETRLRSIARRKQAVAVFPHPLPGGAHLSSERRGWEAGRRSISFIGGTFAIKGFGTFVDIARAHQGAFDFQVIGERTSDYSKKNDSLFSMPPSEGKLRRSVFDSALGSTDIICLPLDPIRYSWAASGTLLDAIAFGIPVLTNRTAITDDWERRYGPFGLLAGNGRDMRRLVQALSDETLDIELNAEQSRARAVIAADRAEPAIAAKFALHGRASS